jgi:prophage tail gpP-like protein
MPEVTFSIISNGFKYMDCWKSIEISMSMDNICNFISVSTIDFFVKNPKLWNIKKGSQYVAMIDGERVSLGYIDEINSNYSSEGSEFKFTGRDKTCDLVDCSYDGDQSEFKKQTIRSIIQAYCTHFNIDLSVDPIVEAQANTIIKHYIIKKSRKCGEQIAELCTDNGILPISLGDGKLTLTKATLNNVSSDILTETNILSANMVDSDIDRFSDYITLTEGAPAKVFSTDADWISYQKENRKLIGTFSDTNIKRNRPYVILTDTATNLQQCEQRSKYEANIRAAKGLTVNYVLEGWIEVNSKKVWKPNTLVVVRDSNFSLNELMLVNSVILSYSPEEGYLTELELVRKDCYSLNEAAIKLQKSGFSL